MKKVLIVLALVLVFATPLMADSLFSFSVLADTPLYSEASADPYAFSTHLAVIRAMDENRKPRMIKGVVVEHPEGLADRSQDRAFYKDMYYMDDALKKENNMYLHMKGGTSVGLLRTSFEGYKWVPRIDFEVNFAGYINTIFNLFSKNEALVFDGSYFVGGSLKVANTVTVRFGMHHFSGHYGDEVIAKFNVYNRVDYSKTYKGGSCIEGYNEFYGGQPGKEYYLVEPVEYVRDNS